MSENWVSIGRVEDVPEGEGRVFEAGSEWVLVCRVEGSFFAVEDTCTHDMGPLGDGPLEDGAEIVCPRHGARFDARTGAVLCFPALVGLRRFPVRVDGAELLLNLGGAERAEGLDGP